MMYCYTHAEDHDERCQSCIDDKKALRPMRIFVLSSGYVAVVLHARDVLDWGGIVIPLAYDSRTPCNIVVERMRQHNPDNLVVFAGGLQEYKSHLAINT